MPLIMRETQRRRLLNSAVARAEKEVKTAVLRLLERRYKALKRELRRANLRKRLLKTDGILQKDDGGWQDWIDEFTNTVQETIAGVVKWVADVESRYWASRGKPVINFDPYKVVDDYQARIGRNIRDIPQDTLSDVQQAISDWYKTDKGLPELIDDLGQYFDENRASRIATTEMVNVTSEVAREQMLAYGITAWKWDAFNDSVTCPVCADLNGQTFSVDDLDAYPPNHPNCLIPGQEIVVPNLAGGSKAFYEGIVIELSTRGGRKLTVTPNHPVLAAFGGWQRAHLFHKGDYLVAHIDPDRMLYTVNPNNHARPAVVEKVFETLEMTGGMVARTMPASPEDFHGDARHFNGDIKIVNPNWKLRQSMDATLSQAIYNKLLSRIDPASPEFSYGPANQFLLRNFPAFGGNVSRFYLGGTPFFSHPAPLDLFGLRLSTPLYPLFAKNSRDDLAINPVGLGDFIFRNSALIELDEIMNIRKYNFSGHVYDFSSDFYSLYICNSIITHNCRCGTLYVTAGGEEVYYS